MFGKENRGKRAAAEAKALNKKAQRFGGQLSGRDAARLTRVKGQVVKYSIEDADDNYNEDEYR